MVGSTSAAKWKKRARHIDMQHPQVQAPGVFLGTRKRGLEYSEGYVLESDNGKQKKSKVVSGVISHNDPMSVEAAEQPRRSQ